MSFQEEEIGIQSAATSAILPSKQEDQSKKKKKKTGETPWFCILS
jgi:hypothetical protein